MRARACEVGCCVATPTAIPSARSSLLRLITGILLIFSKSVTVAMPEAGSLASRLQFRCSYIRWFVLARDRTVPDTASEGCDVDFVLVGGIWNHSMRPFEVESRNPRPVLTSIGRAPGRRFESGCVQNA